VDLGHVRPLNSDGQEQKRWAFTFTMGHSRHMVAEAALDPARFGKLEYFSGRRRFAAVS